MAGKNQTFVWWVDHPGHTTAIVMADNWEQATVEAAKWWEVPWRGVAAMCTEQKHESLTRGMCIDCNAKLWSDGGSRLRCGKCEAIARQKEETQRARNRRFYSDMHRK